MPGSTAILGVILSGIAGAVGALSPALGWRAPAAVAVLLVLMLCFSTEARANAASSRLARPQAAM